MHILLALTLFLVACGAEPSTTHTADASSEVGADAGPCALAGQSCGCPFSGAILPGELVCVGASVTCYCPSLDAGVVDAAPDVGCVPGTSEPCPCPGGVVGARACTASGLDACRCGAAPPPPADVIEARDASDGAVGDACASMTVGNCCGVACERRPNVESAACIAGRCGVGACASGFGDCDRDVTNGCETRLDNSTANCGACGAPCATGRVCVASACVMACPAGFANCDGLEANGCETSITDNSGHCGVCGHVCFLPLRCHGGVCS